MKNGPIVIIGGMGPQASIEVHQRVVDLAQQLFNVRSNDDFPEIVHVSLPVPDFISDRRNSEHALAMIRQSLSQLEVFEPSVVMIACNTAHLLFDELSKSSQLPLVSLIDSVIERVEDLGCRSIGLLASPTTISSQLYQSKLKSKSIRCIEPSKEQIEQLEAMIRRTIAGSDENDSLLLHSFAQEMLTAGCDGVILGCTELPIIYGRTKDARIVDSIDICARRLLHEYYKVSYNGENL